jgi:2-oxo-4-hydroxy-4-carboxy-5-ureidoimidazoline decarboxylase
VTLQAFNALPEEKAVEELMRCCGAAAWAQRLAAARPFADTGALRAAAEQAFEALQPADWLQAFAAHPRIGDLAALRQKFAATATWARGEQAAAADAAPETLEGLAEGNRAYEARFGYIFIVCATGVGADAMLAALRARLGNDPATEARVAGEEQRKITRLRLEKLFKEEA